MQEQICRAQKEQERVGGELAQAGKEIETISGQLREGNRSLNQLPLEEFQAQVMHWNTNAAVAGRAVKDAERRLEEFQQMLAGNLRQQQSIRQRLQNSQGSLQELEGEKAEFRQQENRLAGEIETLQEKIEPAESELQQREQQYEAQQADYLSAQQSVSVAERHVTQAHLELGRNRDGVKSLRRRVEEDLAWSRLSTAAKLRDLPRCRWRAWSNSCPC